LIAQRNWAESTELFTWLSTIHSWLEARNCGESSSSDCLMWMLFYRQLNCGQLNRRSYPISIVILSCVGVVCVTYRRVLYWIIVFIDTLYIHSEPQAITALSSFPHFKNHCYIH
jgi:hypothetical protein